jgi:hypothetical protein
LNEQSGEQNTKPIRHANEVTFVGHRWQFATPDYYIPRTITPFQSTLVVGYYTSKPIIILNPTTINL